MKRWPILAALALLTAFYSVQAAIPLVRVPPAVRDRLQDSPVPAQLRSNKFWVDLPAPHQPPLFKPLPSAPTSKKTVAKAVQVARLATLQAAGKALTLAKRQEEPAETPVVTEPPAEPAKTIVVAEPGPLPFSSEEPPLLPDLADKHGPVRGELPNLPSSLDHLPWPTPQQFCELRVVTGPPAGPAEAWSGGVVTCAAPMPGSGSVADLGPPAEQVTLCAWMDEGPELTPPSPLPAPAPLPASSPLPAPSPLAGPSRPPAMLPTMLPPVLPPTRQVIAQLPAVKEKPAAEVARPAQCIINVAPGGSLILHQGSSGDVQIRDAAAKDGKTKSSSKWPVRPASADLLEPTPLVGPPLDNLPSHETACCPPSGFCFRADLIYWRPRTSALPYSGIVSPIQGGNLVGDNNQSITAVDTGLDWEAGCRFAAGYRTEAGWLYWFTYTHLDTEGATALGNPNIDSNTVYAALFNRSLGAIDPDGLADAAAEQRRFCYNVYDLDAGPCFTPLPCLELTGFAGFRAANIDQGSRVQYLAIEEGGPVRADIARDLQMEAWGLRGGGTSRYRIGSTQFAVLADASLSLLYAEFSGQRFDTLSTVDGDQIQVYFSQVNGITPVLELRVGVNYTYEQFVAAAGYEFTHWFNFYQHADVPGTGNFTPTYRLDRGDLSLDGWFVRGGFRY